MNEIAADRKTVWNDAARSGLVLGGVSIAYMLFNLLMEKLSGRGGAVSAIVNVSSVLVWIFKVYLCIRLMKFFMEKFARNHEGVINSDTFRFGFATALLSALLFSAFYLAWVSFVQPDMFKDAIDAAMESYSEILPASQMSSFDELLPKMPTLTFFTNFFWCLLFGTVLSAIFSRNIPPRNPFADQSDQEQL